MASLRHSLYLLILPVFISLTATVALGVTGRIPTRIFPIVIAGQVFAWVVVLLAFVRVRKSLP